MTKVLMLLLAVSVSASLVPFGFKGFFDDPFDDWSPAFPDFFTHASGPEGHAYESENLLTLEFDVPRYKAEEVTVKVTDAARGFLEIAGKRAAENKKSKGHLLFGHAKPTSFRRTFRLSPRLYTLESLSHKLEQGVLTITVPKVPTPPPLPQLTLFDGAAELIEGKRQEEERLTGHEVSTEQAKQDVLSVDDAIVAKIQRNTKWPPVTKVAETEKEYRYDFTLPQEVAKEHLKVTLQGTLLTLEVHCGHPDKHDGHGSRWVTYSESLEVPLGTVAEAIHTEYEVGRFSIVINKDSSKKDKKTQHVKVKGDAKKDEL